MDSAVVSSEKRTAASHEFIDLKPWIAYAEERTQQLAEPLSALGAYHLSAYATECIKLLHSLVAHSSTPSPTKISGALRYAQGLTEMAWEELHIGDWKDVAMAWRDLYAVGSLLFATTLLCRGGDGAPEAAIGALDKGLLMGGPSFHPRLARCISEIQASLPIRDPAKKQKTETSSPAASSAPSSSSAAPVSSSSSASSLPLSLPPNPTIDPARAIPRVHAPSMEGFFRDCTDMKPMRPIIITGAILHWPAVAKWPDLNYLRRIAGLRTVPIEVGRTYLAAGWGQRLITFNEFLDKYVLPEKRTETGYLAQTQLFDQIPELRADIDTPIYCFLGEEDKDVIINAWFGPAGTVSPTHHDPHHNILAQVVGSKYIRLYDPKWSENLYPHKGKMLFNSSQVDAENPDLAQFPLFSQAEFQECILGPGELLYIPLRWWHYIRSLETSFSVSFWY